MALIPANTALAAGSNPAFAIQATQQVIGVNNERNGLNISLAAASANPLYLLLGSGSASAANFHICVPAGQSWDGMVGPVVWQGAVQAFIPTASGAVGVAEM